MTKMLSISSIPVIFYHLVSEKQITFWITNFFQKELKKTKLETEIQTLLALI